MRPPLALFVETNTIQKVCFAETPGTVVMRSLERRAVHAEREIRGFALRLAEEGNWDVVGQQTAPLVADSHDELSTRSMR
jgi:Catalase